MRILRGKILLKNGMHVKHRSSDMKGGQLQTNLQVLHSLLDEIKPQSGRIRSRKKDTFKL